MGRDLGVRVGLGVAVGGGVAVGVAVGVGVGLAMTDHHLMCEESCRLSPTTTPVKALPANETSLRFTEVPLVWSIQVSPESVVFRILLAQPTAKPLVGCGKSTVSMA